MRNKKVLISLTAAAVLSLGVAGAAYAGGGSSEGYQGGIATAATAAGTSPEELDAATNAWTALFRGDRYPNLARAAQDLPDTPRYDPDAHFEFGLSILLAGLEQRLAGAIVES